MSQLDPYYWAWLPYAKQPFSNETKELILPQLSDMNFVQEMCDELLDLFQVFLLFGKVWKTSTYIYLFFF